MQLVGPTFLSPIVLNQSRESSPTHQQQSTELVRYFTRARLSIGMPRSDWLVLRTLLFAFISWLSAPSVHERFLLNASGGPPIGSANSLFAYRCWLRPRESADLSHKPREKTTTATNKLVVGHSGPLGPTGVPTGTLGLTGIHWALLRPTWRGGAGA